MDLISRGISNNSETKTKTKTTRVGGEIPGNGDLGSRRGRMRCMD